MDPLETELTIREQETAPVPPPPPPGPIPEVLLEQPTKPVRKVPGTPSALTDPRNPDVVVDPSQKETAASIPPVVKIAESPAPEKRVPLVLTELQVARLEVLRWKHKALKNKTAYAENVAQQAAFADARAYEDLLAAAASYGIDVEREFRIDEKGRVTYPIPKGPARPDMPDFAPPPGSTVKT